MNMEFDLGKTIIYFNSLSDVRSNKWPFVQTPYVALLCVFIYLVFVMLGPSLMLKKRSLELKEVMLSYNGILVIWNAYMFLLFLQHGLLNPTYNLICDKVDYSDDRSSLTMAWGIYMYYVSKLVELLDTVFFILRKKNNQVTFLHVYHHATMPLLWWFAAKFVGGGETYLSPLVNTFVHVWMYAYYGLSSFGPWIQPYLWWKKYLTMLQMIQFIIVISKTIYTLSLGCSFPNVYLWGQLVYMLSMFVLFLQFYRQTYKSHSRTPRGKATNGSVTANNHVIHHHIAEKSE